jgi:hypothetical protein
MAADPSGALDWDVRALKTFLPLAFFDCVLSLSSAVTLLLWRLLMDMDPIIVTT